MLPIHMTVLKFFQGEILLCITRLQDGLLWKKSAYYPRMNQRMEYIDGDVNILSFVLLWHTKHWQYLSLPAGTDINIRFITFIWSYDVYNLSDIPISWLWQYTELLAISLKLSYSLIWYARSHNVMKKLIHSNYDVLLHKYEQMNYDWQLLSSIHAD